jgi:hypothetical protein
VEEFAEYTAEKIVKFEKEFLYTTLLRKLLSETTKSLGENDPLGLGSGFRVR